jgi:hypothetical protein
MGFLGTAVKAGLAKKAWTEARKPQNQAKAKQLFGKVTGRSTGGSGGAGTRAGTSRRQRRR